VGTNGPTAWNAKMVRGRSRSRLGHRLLRAQEHPIRLWPIVSDGTLARDNTEFGRIDRIVVAQTAMNRWFRVYVELAYHADVSGPRPRPDLQSGGRTQRPLVVHRPQRPSPR